MTRQIKGMHHVSSFTSDAKKNYEWVTNVLGLRLVKKTVNQDNVKIYHLFYGDDKGSPGTEMTYFEFPYDHKKVDGTDSIHRTSFRVKDDRALEYWIKRFEKYDVNNSGIKERFGMKYIEFEDFDNQNYQLISDENDNGVEGGIPWGNGPVPKEFSIIGLGPSILKVSDFEKMKDVLENMFKYKETKVDGNYHLFEVSKGGNGASLIVEEDTKSNRLKPGAGSIHHLALRVEDEEELREWIEEYNDKGYKNSGFVDRFYFKSTYSKLYPYILFELATDGPGFIDDQESYETLGETLALPPKFESKRKEIEQNLDEIDTKRSNDTFEKEYLGFE